MIGDLVAVVERETAKLSNRDAWPAILAIAQVRGVSGKCLGEFRKLVWQARGAALAAKRLERAAKKAPAREKSWDKLAVVLSCPESGRPAPTSYARSTRCAAISSSNDERAARWPASRRLQHYLQSLDGCDHLSATD